MITHKDMWRTLRHRAGIGGVALGRSKDRRSSRVLFADALLAAGLALGCVVVLYAVMLVAKP